MKLHLIATVLLAVAAPDAVSAKKLRGAECTEDQIPCSISSSAECHKAKDRTSSACRKTWSNACCTRDCKSNGKGLRVCRKVVPPSENYFGIFGIAAVEDYVGDEDSEDFDSEDEDSEDMIFRYY